MNDNITFITHLRMDHSDRAKNLQTILNYYSKNCPGSRFIMVEDDSEHNKGFDSIKWPKNTSFYFIKNKGLHLKSRSLNYGIKQAETPVIVALDTDCIVPISSIHKCVEATMNGVTMAYPYNGFFIDATYAMHQLFKEADYDFSILRDPLPAIDTLYLGQQFPEFYVRCTNTGHLDGQFHQGVGGIAVFNKDLLIEMGGYNEKFIGWGGEDNEINERCLILEHKQFRDDDIEAVCFHLFHQSAVRNNNPYYDANMVELTKMDPKKISKQELLDYVKTWDNFK
jgi:hypothetical protein